MVFKNTLSPLAINTMNLPNRCVRSATYDSASDSHGNVTEDQLQLFSSLVQGQVGLIISGIASVHQSGRISPFQLDLSHDGCIPGLKSIAEVVHAGWSKIAVQLFHAGREGERYQSHIGQEALAPSSISDDPYCDCTARSMNDEDIVQIIDAFGNAAAWAKEAGIDAVQVHAAHAYLISQFLSPHTNRRMDRWGGSLEGRFSFLQSIYKDIRSKVGPQFPVLIKLGVEDGFPEGLPFTEGKQIARWCSKIGFDAIEISQGLRGKYYQQTEFRTGIVHGKNEGYFRDWARNVRMDVHVPVIMVGGLRSPFFIEDSLEQGDADAAALSRPLIREPDLIARWQSGDSRSSSCVSCNRCFEAVRKGKFLRCLAED